MAGIENPEEALIIANRARELGFSSTVGVIHDGDGLNKGLTAREKEIYYEIKEKGARSYARWNWFQDKLVEGEEYEWRCRSGARYLYVCEEGLVHWCSQQRGTPGISIHEYTQDDMHREYHTEKWCAPQLHDPVCPPGWSPRRLARQATSHLSITTRNTVRGSRKRLSRK